MRIEGSNRTQNVSGRGRVKRQGADGEVFQPDVPGESAQATQTSDAAPAAGLDGLLALQAVEDPVFAKRKAVKRGQNMLDVLEEMKADLLAGEVSEGRLNRLMALVQQAKLASTPELDSLIADIELRARVELAKLGRFPSL